MVDYPPFCRTISNFHFIAIDWLEMIDVLPCWSVKQSPTASNVALFANSITLPAYIEDLGFLIGG